MITPMNAKKYPTFREPQSNVSARKIATVLSIMTNAAIEQKERSSSCNRIGFRASRCWRSLRTAPGW